MKSIKEFFKELKFKRTYKRNTGRNEALYFWIRRLRGSKHCRRCMSFLDLIRNDDGGTLECCISSCEQFGIKIPVDKNMKVKWG